MENIKKMHNIVTKKEMIPFSNTVPPHNVHYGFPLWNVNIPVVKKTVTIIFVLKNAKIIIKC